MPRIEVRPLESPQEFKECERIQKVVWGNVGVSSELMTVTQKYGGAVLGARVGGKTVGFIYAFLAQRRGRLIHWSHLMAVEPGFRDLGLGFRMKLAHRRLALQKGLSSICWTYDPLQSRNAALNIGRLGARVEEYAPDCYGRFPSRIEKGLASDRFVVNWRLATARVERRIHARSLTAGASPIRRGRRVNKTRRNARSFLENRRIALGLRASRLEVEIPNDTDQMRTRALDLARRWRMETRKIFQQYLRAGYSVSDFVPPGAATEGRCFYVLRKGRITSDT